MRFQNKTILLFMDKHTAHLYDTSDHNNVKIVFPRTASASSSHINEGIIWSHKHYYHKQLVRYTVSLIDQKLLHDATLMKLTVVDATHFTAISWCFVTHIKTLNYWFNVNQTNDGEDAKEYIIPKDDCRQLKVHYFKNMNPVILN